MIGGLEKQISNCEETCDHNHLNLSAHIDRISLKYAENTVDLTSCSEGFQREIERVQILFRELQAEFLTTLEEKRTQNVALLKGTGVKDKEINIAQKQAKDA